MKQKSVPFLAVAVLVLFGLAIWLRPTVPSFQNPSSKTMSSPPPLVTPAPSPAATTAVPSMATPPSRRGLCLAAVDPASPLLSLASWRHLRDSRARILILPAQNLECIKFPFKGRARLVRFEAASQMAYDDLGDVGIELSLEQTADSFDALWARKRFFISDLGFGSEAELKQFLASQGAAADPRVVAVRVDRLDSPRPRSRASAYDSYPYARILTGAALKEAASKGGTLVLDLAADPKALAPLAQGAVAWDVNVLRSSEVLPPSAVKATRDRIQLSVSKNVDLILVGLSAVDRAPYNAVLWLANNGYFRLFVAREGADEFRAPPSRGLKAPAGVKEIEASELGTSAVLIDTRDGGARLMSSWKNALWWPASRPQSRPASAALTNQTLVFAGANEEDAGPLALMEMALKDRPRAVLWLRGGFDELRLRSELGLLPPAAAALFTRLELPPLRPSSAEDLSRQKSGRPPAEMIRALEELKKASGKR